MKTKTPAELAKLDDIKLNRYFGKQARHLPQSQKEPYYVTVETTTLWAKTPKQLFVKFRSLIKKLAKAPAAAPKKAERTLVCMLNIPLSKTGVDVRDCLRPTDIKTGKPLKKREETPSKAFSAYSKLLRQAAEIAQTVSIELQAKQGVSVDADATIVQISGPESVLKPLVKRDLLYVDKIATKEANSGPPGGKDRL